MTSPSTPTMPGSHSRGLTFKQGIITAVDGNIAYVRTTLTDTIPVRRDIMRAKGRLPEVGETWMITREFGLWAFALILIGGEKSNSVPQSDVVDLEDDLEEITGRLDDQDDQLTLLNRYMYSWASLQELSAFNNVLQSLSLFSAVHSVAVASAGRYVNFGLTPFQQLITGVRIFVTASVASSTIQFGLYQGSINSMQLIDITAVSTSSTGMKSVNWSTPHSTVPNQYLAVGMVTTASSTLAIGGFESAIISNAPKAQVAALGATTLASPLVMGPTTPHSITQGRHWVGLF